MDKKQFFGVLNILQLFITAFLVGGFIAYVRDPMQATVYHWVNTGNTIRTNADEARVTSNILRSMTQISQNITIGITTDLRYVPQHSSEQLQEASKTDVINGIDIHLENNDVGLTYETSGHRHVVCADGLPCIVPRSIAIGLAITSFKSQWKTAEEVVSSFPFFSSLLPSFCETASRSFNYNFFLAYDKNDNFFTKPDNLQTFADAYKKIVTSKCPKESNYSLHFTQCVHAKKPAWAQNDAMMSAYMSNMEYYYRINDDTKMKTKNWTEMFIKTLRNFRPPNVGVVGPTHKGGNTGILTYDFVHYTHIEIHGFYYPRGFKNWYADNWITQIYKPGRCVKDSKVLLQHTLQKGQRYKNEMIKPAVVKAIVLPHQKTIQR